MSVALANKRSGRAINAPAAAVETSSDEMLLARIANGDRSAMRTLYARHHVAVYRFVIRTIEDAAAAETLVSEVFFDAWRQASRMRSSGAGVSVTTWLLTIARRKALAIASDRGRADHPALPKGHRGELLRCALAGLSAQHREVIDLVYYHRKSIDEVAEIVGVPVVAAKARMLDARRALAELIGAA